MAKKRRHRKKYQRQSKVHSSSVFFLGVVLCAFYLAWSRVGKGGEPTGLLEIELHGLSDSTGVVAVALFDSKEAFDTKGKPFQKAFLIAASDIHEGTARVKFDAIPFGTYAIAAFHDVNKNGQLDTNFLGMPQEDFGFSNNVMGLLSKPSYERASFEVVRRYQFKRIKLD